MNGELLRKVKKLVGLFKRIEGEEIETDMTLAYWEGVLDVLERSKAELSERVNAELNYMEAEFGEEEEG